MSARETHRALCALWLVSLFAFGCQKGPELRGKIAGLKEISAEAARSGAKNCAPRELALTDAYIQFAELELARGKLTAAERHVIQAELNARAAQEQSPAEHCLRHENAPPPPPPPKPGDKDGDGYLDPDDKCPTDPENFNGFEDGDGCPDDPDTDGDGLKDTADACILLAEDKDSYLDEDGCPELDNDVDGLPDLADKCPLEPEDPDGFDDSDGCPDPDNDGDEVLDGADECPATPGQKDKAPLGCPLKPALVVVTDCEVKITQQIHFATNKDIIKPESYPILNAVVDALDKNPAFKIEVQGHTDDKGANAYNLDLSQRRAQSVRKYLVSHGIDAARLTAKGYGEEVPLVANDSEANRALNRRVQFVRTEGPKEGCGPGATKSTQP
jgi:OmpA-OmpF porin, OOP family